MWDAANLPKSSSESTTAVWRILNVGFFFVSRTGCSSSSLIICARSLKWETSWNLRRDKSVSWIYDCDLNKTLHMSHHVRFSVLQTSFSHVARIVCIRLYKIVNWLLKLQKKRPKIFLRVLLYQFLNGYFGLFDFQSHPLLLNTPLARLWKFCSRKSGWLLKL